MFQVYKLNRTPIGGLDGLDVTSCPHVSVVLDLLSLFYLFSIKNIPQVRFSSAAVISYNNSRLKVVL